MGEGQTFLSEEVTTKFAQAKPSIEILQGLLNGLLIRKEDLRPYLLAYIQAKTETSDRLPSKFKYFFEK